MLILAAAIIPLLILLGYIGYGWWQFDSRALRFLLAVPAAVLIVWGLDSLASYSMTSFKEVWNFRITSVQYQERWTTEESRTETYQSGTDSKGNPIYSSRTIYYTETHGPYWYAIDEYGDSHTVDQDVYEHWRQVWNNTNHTATHTGSSHGFDTCLTGQVYDTRWPQTFDTIYPWSEVRRYENRVRVTSTNFGFRKADKVTAAKYPRPVDNDDFSVMHGYGIAVNPATEAKLRRMNADFGKTYRIHTLVLLFDCAKEEQRVMLAVRDAWQGPNKNELVVCIGLTQTGVIDWVDVMSWMDDTTIHALIRQDLLTQPTPGTAPRLDGDRLLAVLRDRIPKYWHKKDFHAFDYLGIETPWWTWVLGLLLSIGVAIGATFIIVKYDEDNGVRFGRRKSS